MKKPLSILTLTFTLLLLAFNLAVAQPTIQWEKSLGGANIESANDIIQAYDGGFFVTGLAWSNDGDLILNQGGKDCWVVKLDVNGNIVWQQSFGGSGEDYVFSLLQLPDSGLILFANTNSADGDISNIIGANDIWVIRLDKDGVLVWERTYGGTNSEFLIEAIKHNDGNYVFAGYTESNDGDVTLNKGGRDYWLVKIDTLGNIIWQKTYGGGLDDEAFSVIQSTDNGFLIFGESKSIDGDVTNNIGDDDYWVVKTDSLGNIEWEKNYGGTNRERGLSCSLGINGGYVLTGSAFSNDGDVSIHFGPINKSDFWVVKIDNLGNLEWEKTYGGSQMDEAIKIVPYNTGYVVLGNINSSNGMISTFYGDTTLIDPDFWLIHIDTLGNLLWEKNYGGSLDDWVGSMKICNNNEIVMTGATGSVDYDVSNNNGIYDFWVVKLDALTGIEKEQLNKDLSIYPNPTENEFNIDFKYEKGQIEVYDILGQKIISVIAKKGINNIYMNNMKAGSYIVKIESEDGITTGKLIIK